MYTRHYDNFRYKCIKDIMIFNENIESKNQTSNTKELYFYRSLFKEAIEPSQELIYFIANNNFTFFSSVLSTVV